MGFFFIKGQIEEYKKKSKISKKRREKYTEIYENKARFKSHGTKIVKII